jgi:hypothetical protein
MKLLTDEIRRKLPRDGAQDGLAGDAIVHAHLFSPYSGWDWYLLEFDGDDLLFGYTVGTHPEYGYSSLAELEQAKRGQLQLVERDRHWTPKPIGEVFPVGHPDRPQWWRVTVEQAQEVGAC